jgi:hypothetical protein
MVSQKAIAETAVAFLIPKMKEILIMTKTKMERIAGIEAEIKQLENQKKKLLQQQKEQERKARTRRLIERGALLESLIDGAEAFTNEDIKSILTAALKSGPALDVIIPILKRQSMATIAQSETEQGAWA